ncbi:MULTISPECIES: sensor domain-containing diguanylate cyclase [unclassified Thioalkalivibrio]|uniref:sensor domain-containing diguanylate cyclase n=1 Tax=unclassified Thioalkalivibrio TaxID=2621013 RepID=UPI00036112BF|nr:MULTISPECIES: sensor domain-containing diguanylate cyclase [unclassified Thioalkalivibrio]
MDDISRSNPDHLIQRLRTERDQLLTLLKALPDISFVIDEDGLYVRVNGGANEAMYVSGKGLEGRSVTEALPPAVAEACLEAIRTALRTGDMQTLEYQLRVDDVAVLTPSAREATQDGIEQCFEGRVLPLPGYDHPKPVVLWVAVNITPRKQLEQYWREAAETDPLTGIANRRALFERAHSEVERARRYGHPLSLLIMDIDHFKSINTRFGHARGDEALRCFTQACAELLRTNDCLGRIGGEEFVILLPDTDLSGAASLGKRVVEQTRSITVADTPIAPTLTVSAGTASLDQGEGFEEALRRADAALSRAKENGRNRLETDDTSAGPDEPQPPAD